VTNFATFLPDCWEEANAGDGTTGPMNFGAGFWEQDGTTIARINLFTTGTSDWLVSPEFDLSAGGLGLIIELSGQDFGSATGTFSGMGSDDTLEVFISSDGGTSWTLLNTHNNANPMSATASTVIIDLSSYTGASNIIGIRANEGVVSDPEDYWVNIHSFEINSSVLLSVNTVDDSAAFTYYPNPVKNTLTLNAKNTIDNVTMFNMLGQEVLRITPNAINSTIDMSNLDSGAYFARVTINGNTDSVKIIKQ